LALLLAAPVWAKAKLTKSTFTFEGKARTYYSYIPDKEGPLPVLVLLHGSGRDGEIAATPWKDMAAREGFILAAPNSLDSAMWSFNNDSPRFLHAVVKQIGAQHAIDESRIYLFGHSAGAAMGLILAVVDSHYFAAVAVHAGSLQVDPAGLFAYAERRTPLSIQVGDQDLSFPLQAVLSSKKKFEENGFEVKLTVIPHHDHNYYAISDEVDTRAWLFLKDKALPVPYTRTEAENRDE
jgi:predicted esterase